MHRDDPSDLWLKKLDCMLAETVDYYAIWLSIIHHHPSGRLLLAAL
jgi:hypothetical protein